jgi:hypothetical protein
LKSCTRHWTNGFDFLLEKSALNKPPVNILFSGGKMKKLLFITWSVSYGYGTEKSLADVLNRMDRTRYDISILPLFKNSHNTIFNDNIKILNPVIDYTSKYTKNYCKNIFY